MISMSIRKPPLFFLPWHTSSHKTLATFELCWKHVRNQIRVLMIASLWWLDHDNFGWAPHWSILRKKKHLFQISMSFITYLVVFQYLFCPELVFQDEKRRCSLNMPSMESAGQFNIPPGSSCCSKVPISALLIFQVKVITWGPTLQKPTSKVGTLGFFRNQCADW